MILYGIQAKKYSVCIGMFFVFLIMGFQENCLTDYLSYKEHYNDKITGYTTKEGEFAYTWLWMKCSYIIGFHLFVTLTSFIQCLIIMLTIKKYAAIKYQYFGVLIVFFTFNIMLIQMTAMRQGYAVEMLLLAYYLLSKHKYLISLSVAIIAYGFHNSVIVAIPFFIGFWIFLLIRSKDKAIDTQCLKFDKKKSERFAMWILIVFISFYFLKFVVFASYINPILASIEAFSFSGYLDRLDNDRSIAWWIMLYNTIIIYLTAMYYTIERNIFKKYFAFLTIIYLFLYIATFGFGDLMRINMFFVIFTPIVFPNITSMIRLSYGKKAAIAFVIFNMTYIMYFSVPFMLSFNSDNHTGFGTYMFSFLA